MAINAVLLLVVVRKQDFSCSENSSTMAIVILLLNITAFNQGH